MSEGKSFKEAQRESRMWGIFHAGETLGVLINVKRGVENTILRTPTGPARDAFCNLQIKLAELDKEFRHAVVLLQQEYHEGAPKPQSLDEAIAKMPQYRTPLMDEKTARVQPHENPITSLQWAENIHAQAIFMAREQNLDYEEGVNSTIRAALEDGGLDASLENEVRGLVEDMSQ